MNETNNKIIAALDLGSQTFRLAVAVCSNKGVEVKGSWLENVRLGQGLSATGQIGTEAFQRGLSALQKFKRIIKDTVNSPKNPPIIKAVGTAALRRAENADLFVKKALEIGIDIDILSERQEAVLTATGVLSTLEEISKDQGTNNKPIFIIDAGGGSTEISVCSSSGIIQWTSIEIGAVRLTEDYFKDSPSPPSPQNLRKMTERVRHELDRALDETLYPPGSGILVGSGGTATTVAAMELGMESYTPWKIRGMRIPSERLEQWIIRLSQMTKSQKDSICGLEPERSDIILSGIVIIYQALKKLGLPELVVSDGGLLLGLLTSTIKKECTSHAEPSCPGGIYV